MLGSLRGYAKVLLRLPTLVGVVFGGVVFLVWWHTMRMPGRSFHGPLSFSTQELALSTVLQRDVRFLSTEIGERNTRKEVALGTAGAWIERQLHESSLTSLRIDWITGDSRASP
jgi:hypothetical protein